MRKMRKLSYMAAGLAALTISASIASAQDGPTIFTGGTGGAYFNDFGPTVADILGDSPSDEVRESGILGDPDNPELVFINYTLTNTDGTGDNKERVKAAPSLNLGVGQFNEVATDADGLWFVDTGAKECLFGVSSNNSITSASNLNPRVPFGLPGAKSGSASTFMRLEPFASMRNVKNFESTKAMLRGVAAGEVPAGGFVQLPDTTNPNFEAAAHLHFFGVINRRMLREKVNGISVYTGVPDILVSPGSGWQVVGLGDAAKKVTTACTPVVIFGTDPSLLTGYDAEDMALIRDTLKKAANEGLLIPDTGDWRSMFADMAERVASGQSAIETFLNEQVAN